MSGISGLASAIRRLLIRPLFVVDIRDGSVVVRSGEPPAGLVAEFAATAHDLGLANGTIYAVRAAQGLTLDFSTNIPESQHQRFRNVFGVYRHRVKTG